MISLARLNYFRSAKSFRADENISSDFDGDTAARCAAPIGVFSLFAAYFKGFTLLFTNFCEKSLQKFRDLEGAALCARPLRALLYRSRAHSPFKRSRANWVVLRESVISLARVIMPQIHTLPTSRSVGKLGCAGAETRLCLRDSIIVVNGQTLKN